MKTAKLLFTVFAMLGALGLQAQANAIDKYFQQYVEDERFSVVYISPKMFQMFDKLNIDELDMDDEEGKAFMEIAKGLRGLRILTTDVDPGKFYREAKNKINTSEYQVLMTVRSKGEDNVDFLIREEGNTITELLLLAGGDDSFALLSFVGNIDLEKVSRLAKEMDKGKKEEKKN